MRAKVNIFKFNDYRNALKALIEQRKKNRQAFSYRWFADRAGLSSPNFLNLVVKGKRHLSAATTEKVIEIFQLNKEEAIFFRNLVRFNKAKTLPEREQFAAQLIRSKKFLNEYPLSKEQFEYYSEWYNIPIKESLGLSLPPKTIEEISDSLVPKISKTEAQNAINKLIKLDLIEKQSSRYVSKRESVSTGHKFSNYGVVSFHKKMMTLASESLERFPSAEREISSVTIGASRASFEKIKTEIEEFRLRLMAIAEEDQNKEQVYQLNFQLFPLTKKTRSP